MVGPSQRVYRQTTTRSRRRRQTPVRHAAMISVGLVLCAVAESLGDFLTAYALTDYNFHDAVVLATEEAALSLHVGLLLAVVLGCGAWICSVLARWWMHARLDTSQQASSAPHLDEPAATVVRE